MNRSIPAVSVIIPTYNCAFYLTQSINSVLHQSFQNFELIVVDDGSTDDTKRVLESYQDSIRYFYQPNQGVAAARNHGLSEARGELIAFLDADDRFWPQKLSEQVNFFQTLQTSQTSLNLGIIISGWQLVNESGEKISNIEPWKWCPELNLETMVLYKPARPSATMIRRHWCEKVGGFDTTLSSAEDLDFLLRLMLAGCDAAWIPELLVDYRQRSNSLMSQGYRLIEDTERVMQQFFQHPEIPDHISSLQHKERRQSYLWLAARMYYENHLPEMEHCLKTSLQYTAERTLKTAFEWFQCFQGYAQKYGHSFDAYPLTHSPAWQNALAALLPIPKSVPSNSGVSSYQSSSSNLAPTSYKHRVLLYSDDPGAGGILQCNHAIVSHLAQSGYAVSHLHYCQDTPLNQQEHELGIVQIDLGYHAGNDFTRTLKDIEGSKQYFRSHQPGLIIFSDGWPFSNVAAKQAAIDLNIPYIIVLGFIEPSCEKYDYQDGVPYLNLVALQYAHAQSVISVSHNNLSLLRQIFQLPETIGQIIYNGRPDLFFLPQNPTTRQTLRQQLDIASDAIVCFTSGRLEPVKGYQYQVEAIRILRASPIWPQIYFVWAGMGAEYLSQSNELELKQAVAELRISDRIKFLGQRWDIPDLLDMSDIFILVSEAEGMPLSVMEAMAKGLPVIASAVSGIPEELGETGQLLPNPTDAPEEAIALLAETIEHWASSQELRQTIGDACRQRAQKFFKESTMVRQYEAIIAQCFESMNSTSDNSGVATRLKRLSPPQKLDIQRQFRYTASVWQAWYQYQHQNEDLMKAALEQALALQPIGLGLPVMEWGKMFARFCQKQGEEFDSYGLTRSPTWKTIMSLWHLKL